MTQPTLAERIALFMLSLQNDAANDIENTREVYEVIAALLIERAAVLLQNKRLVDALEKCRPYQISDELDRVIDPALRISDGTGS